MKWLLLATVFSILAIVIMVIGLMRNNKIANKPAEIPEEEEGNKKLGQKIFYKHAAVAGILRVIAVIIFFASKGAGA